MLHRLLIAASLATVAIAGPYPEAPPYPGQPPTNTDAISKDDPGIVQWASGYLNYEWGTNVSSSWRTPAKAYGPATEDVMDIVCLGDNGKITMFFPHPIMDGQGMDFAVFENSFSDSFLELAFVEVSSDGVNFFRFANSSLTPAATNGIDPTNLSGLAGKYRGGWGTPFDLASLPVVPELDKNNVRFVRLIDILGNGTAKDSNNHAIYDPYPNIGSAGFDLDAIGVIHRNDGDFQMVRSGINGTNFELEWASNPGSSYIVQRSTDLDEWFPVQTIPGDQADGATFFTTAKPADTQCYWRIVRQ